LTPAVGSALIRIRAAEPRDAAEIAAVAAESPGAAPWSPNEYEGAARGDYEGWVAEQDGRVIGFIFMRVMADEMEILNLAVTPQRRRLGIATLLIERAIGRAKTGGAARAYLEVRPSNFVAAVVYAKHGFALAGRRACYYSSPVEDALLLSKNLV
jgi:[ribosomal protein S18]-alanine N-acetyltransferase